MGQSPQTALLLLKYGAKLSLSAQEDGTPFDLARAARIQPIVELFKSFNNNPAQVSQQHTYEAFFTQQIFVRKR